MKSRFFCYRKRQDLLIDELKKSNIKFDIGKLSIGDFVWIARPKNKSGGAQDIILNCVVERKRIDDFCSSIIDGRYKEQKVSSFWSPTQWRLKL